ncbi:hypothetical protein IEQ34_006212 [Dendrobium chrysotoxum]|uniref:Uncharacterized protein n=1 Tax=Dendrobium chrysotoxum TaxID=161865 RepID=A0AAV7GX71_DENCH|nr:hypothetical protein IEQ34_006212 [Dendrobium chrysotoxum]
MGRWLDVRERKNKSEGVVVVRSREEAAGGIHFNGNFLYPRLTMAEKRKLKKRNWNLLGA